jgi:predicted O-methyltransferase YrrM
MKKIDQLSENQIRRKEENFIDYIAERSKFIGESYQYCFHADKDFYKCTAIYPAIQLINLMNYERGVELGVFSGHSTITMLNLCNNLKTLYCIDSYQSYTDYYTENFHVDQYESQIIKNLALKKINACDDKGVVTFYEEDSNRALNRFQDGELDFIFLDAHLNAEHIRNDLEKWYPKVRSGGLVMIHDTNYPTVKEEIMEFMERINFDGKYSNVIDLSCLLKN